jgi:hypothetical protein
MKAQLGATLAINERVHAKDVALQCHPDYISKSNVSADRAGGIGGGAAGALTQMAEGARMLLGGGLDEEMEDD